MTLFQKELLENWRNFKWIWVPLVTIVLAIMDPITNYFLPQIIETVGGVPEGAVIDLPMPSATDAMMMSLGQLNTLGVLIFVLISMGTISGERKSGVAEIVLTKPVSFRNYVTAKWVSWVLLIWVSLILGLGMSWYYINILFGDISFLVLIQVIFFYGLWLTLVVTISIFFNTIFRSPGVVAFMTITTVMLLSVMTSIFSHVLTWSPNKLSAHIHQMLLIGEVPNELIGSAGVTIGLIITLLIAAIVVINKKEIAE